MNSIDQEFQRLQKEALQAIVSCQDIQAFSDRLVKSKKISKRTGKWMLDVHRVRGYNAGTGYGISEELANVILENVQLGGGVK